MHTSKASAQMRVDNTENQELKGCSYIDSGILVIIIWQPNAKLIVPNTKEREKKSILTIYSLRMSDRYGHFLTHLPIFPSLLLLPPVWQNPMSGH